MSVINTFGLLAGIGVLLILAAMATAVLLIGTGVYQQDRANRLSKGTRVVTDPDGRPQIIGRRAPSRRRWPEDGEMP